MRFPIIHILVESFRSSTNSLVSHKLRSGLTLLSITIGVATIIAIVSIISGLNKSVANQFASLGTSVLYVERFPWVAIGGRSWSRIRRNRPITNRELAAIQRIKEAYIVTPLITTMRTAYYKGNQIDATVRGTSWQYPELRKFDLEDGRFFTHGEDEKGKPVCVIGWEVYKTLFEKGSAIGKRIRVGSSYFTVVGVIAKQGQSFGFGSFDDNIIIPYHCFISSFGGRRNLTVLVAAKNPDEIELLRERIRIALRGIRGLKPGTPDDFSINSQEMLLKEYKETTRNLWAAIFAIGGLALLVGGIGIMNIMLITVNERIREIGIRKALGATKLHILLQFLLEALIQCWIGGAVGFIGGVMFPFAISLIVKQLPFALSSTSVAVAIIFTSAIGLIFGIYPALKAAKMSPVDALRYE